MTHIDILKYALALGEGKDIYDKTHNICYIPDVDINGKWLGIFTIFYDRYSSYYSFNYKKIAFVTQPKPNHYVAYFENYYERFLSSLNKWFKYDDTKGYYKEIKILN